MVGARLDFTNETNTNKKSWLGLCRGHLSQNAAGVAKQLLAFVAAGGMERYPAVVVGLLRGHDI